MAGERRTGTEERTEVACHETLSRSDVGLADEEIPFVFTPAERWSPLVISFPHVGLRWPDHFLRPAPQVHFGRNADYEVHRLYPRATATGAATIQAIYSRLLVDLNRAPDDVSPELVPDHPAPRPRPGTGGPGTLGRIPNRGVLWDTAVGNIPILSAPVAFAELGQRLQSFYHPYYRAVRRLLERRRERFGYAVLLEAHSMPSSVLGDIILGTLEGGACDPALEQIALDALRSPDPRTGRGLDVRLNNPYRGGHLVRSFGRPERGLHALQVEVNRALYMDETNLQVWAPSASAAGHERSRARLLTHRRRRLDLLLARLDVLVNALAATSLDTRALDVANTPLSSPRTEASATLSSPPSATAQQRGDSLVQPCAAGLKSR
ncbi:MAG: N-formylglutamate amidohydrolase [Nannocystaceae bacterium]